jgi:hypothetical protein
MSNDTALVWNKRFPILDESHQHDLDARAAVNEFKNRLPRQVAEERAHKDYMREHAIAAAAHHLLGVRASHASGHDEAAAKHGEAYAGAMKAAGLDPFGAPHEDILNHIKANKPEVYSFKAHPADQLFTPEHREPDEADTHIQKLLEGLGSLRQRLTSK